MDWGLRGNKLESLRRCIERIKAKRPGSPAVYYPKCLHEQPVFKSTGNKLGDFPEAEKASREVLSLPMHPLLDEATQERIVSSLRTALTD